MNEMQYGQLSGFEKVQSIGGRASINKNPESEDEDSPLKASDMKESKHPAKSLYQNQVNLEDEILAPEEDYHSVHLCEDKIWGLSMATM